MNLNQLIDDLFRNTLGSHEAGWGAFTFDSSLWAIMPESILCLTILLMLTVRVFDWGRRVDMFYVVLFGSLLALYCAAPWAHLGGPLTAVQLAQPEAVSRMEIFTGMLVYDTFSVFMRSLLLLFLVLFAILTKLSGLPDRQDGPDIYTLVLGSTVGLCLMTSANHLFMIFLAVEMASVPSYALAGMLKGRRQASEAALKFSIYGAGAAGVMLYGISLVAGLINTAHLPTMAVQLAQQLPVMGAGELMVLSVAALMIMVGLAFKLSAVPFHFWAPDVFEGASSEVNAFLSVASKAAALALLVRVAIGFGAIPPQAVMPGERTAAIAAAGDRSSDGGERLASGLFSVADVANRPEADAAGGTEPPRGGQLEDDATDPAAAVATSEALAPVRGLLAKMIALLAIVTCTFGNLAAYGQTNIKRLLAYSTIAHAGYMMMAVPAMMAMAAYSRTGAQSAVSALAIYISIYLFMNLGAFAVVAFLRNAMLSEEIADYAGLIRRCPVLVVCFSLMLFSLVGIPPLAGFIGKFAIFGSLVDGYQVTARAGEPAFYLVVLLLAGGINTAISLFYYLRVVKVMTLDPEPEERRPFVFSDVSLQGAYIWLVTVPTALLILQWETLNRMAQAAARHLLS